jgi:asparagine synthase (glutamine-hydrolysing)
VTALAGVIGLDVDDGASHEEEAAVLRMLERMLGRTPRARYLVRAGRSALGRGTLTESRREGVPMPPPDARILVLADARLDDEAVARAFDRGVDRARESPDEAAIREAYLRYGERCAAHLVGDFAFVIVDRDRRRVLLARDVLGNRSLCYAVQPSTLTIASEADAVLAGASRTAEPDVEALARQLAFLESPPGRTLWRGVHRLRPGHTVVFEGGRERAFRHASLEPRVTLPAMVDEDYAALLREHLERAVRLRMRRSRAVGVAVSGGTDSASVACVAEEQRRRERRLAAPVLALHSRYPGLACDEASAYRAVVSYAGLGSAERDMVAESAWSSPRRALLPGAPLYYPSAYAFDAHFADAAASGVDTVLTGEGSDACLVRTPYDHLERARQGGLYATLRQAAGEGASLERLRRLVDRTARQAIPWRLRRLLLPLRRLEPHPILATRWHRAMTAAYLDELAEWDARRDADPATSWILLHLEHGWLDDSRSRLDHFARRRGILLEHPFLDADLVRLLVAMPHAQRHASAPGKPKPVLRRAMRGLVPEVVLRRLRAAEYSSFVRVCIEELHADAFAELRLPSRLLELGLVRDDLRLEFRGAGPLAVLYRRLEAAALELWLRQRRP